MIDFEKINELAKGYSIYTKQIKLQFDFDNEVMAGRVVDDFKNNQGDYMLADRGIKYTAKKDRKSGEIIEEHWTTTVVIEEVE